MYTLVVQTDPLFAEPEINEGNSDDVTPLTIDDLESEASFDLLSSPRKMLARSRPKNTAKNATLASAPTKKTIADMPDPNGIYSKFIACYPEFSRCEVVPPLLYDANQNIIHPDEYSTRLVHLAPVSIEANIRLWEIAPENGRTGARQNGSRAYQLILKLLQVLPYIPKELRKPPPPAKGKGKRRAAEMASGSQDADGPSTPPKRTRRTDDIDSIFNDRDVSMAY
ncbi:hypothetical protein BYT27DRAFT_6878622 [Phlegmacium glaucopus]|nr:hypothetical protein BYT27DRAFT_6878622 [Phlegmacium glaucopus]